MVLRAAASDQPVPHRLAAYLPVVHRYLHVPHHGLRLPPRHTLLAPSRGQETVNKRVHLGDLYVSTY